MKLPHTTALVRTAVARARRRSSRFSPTPLADSFIHSPKNNRHEEVTPVGRCCGCGRRPGWQCVAPGRASAPGPRPNPSQRGILQTRGLRSEPGERVGLVMGLVTAKSWHVTDHPRKSSSVVTHRCVVPAARCSESSREDHCVPPDAHLQGGRANPSIRL